MSEWEESADHFADGYFWYRTRNGKCRHMSPSDFGHKGSTAKILMCQDHPLSVHACTKEEITGMPPCPYCLQTDTPDVSFWENLL